MTTVLTCTVLGHIYSQVMESRGFCYCFPVKEKKKKSNFINVNILWTAYHLSCGHTEKNNKKLYYNQIVVRS